MAKMQDDTRNSRDSCEYPKKNRMDSFKQYKEALKQRYLDEKLGTFAHFLAVPSQGNLRDLCMVRCAAKQPADLEIFRNFLGFQYDENQKNRILQSREKFRPITNFLNGKSDLSDQAAADMLAMLLDFERRPFPVFLKSINKGKTAGPKSGTVSLGANPTSPLVHRRKKNRLSVVLAIASIAILSTFVFFSSVPQCMKWKVNRYEAVDCSEDGNLVALDESLAKMRKIDVGPQTQFFDDGRPLVWYCRQDGKTEFFNMPGNHPETGKKLVPISVAVARKYQKQEKSTP